MEPSFIAFVSGVLVGIVVGVSFAILYLKSKTNDYICSSCKNKSEEISALEQEWKKQQKGY